MNKVQLIVAALAMGAASVTFADDTMTAPAPATDSGMSNCVTQMNQADCDKAGGKMSGTSSSGTAVGSCITQMSQADCDKAGGKMDNTAGASTNGSSSESSAPEAPESTQ